VEILNTLLQVLRSNDNLSAELQIDYSELELRRKERIFRNICYLIVVLYANAIAILTILAILTGNILLIIGNFVYLAALPVYLTLLRLNIRKNYKLFTRITIATASIPTTYVSWLFDNNPAVTLGLNLLLLGISLALLDAFDLIIVTIIVILLCSGIYLNHDIFNLVYSPNLIDGVGNTVILILTVGILIPGIVALIYVPYRSQVQAIKLQNNRLQTALAELGRRQLLNQQVSQQVLTLVVQLNSNASQQATGSQEQASTIAEINTSLSELSATAKNIEDLANQVDLSANKSVINSSEIEQIASLAVQHGEKGLAAVQNTVDATTSVATLYGQMLETLTELSNKNVSMRTILDLLSTLASETHLLSLNAAIEAAGAGEFGERFGVVAQEVKKLAARSAAASRQVVAIIQEIENAQQEAVSTAESGYTKAMEMRQIANETGQIIAEMSAVSGQAQTKMNEVNEIAREIKQSTEIIRAVTSQQSSASQQVLDALNGLNTIAHQSTISSQQVSASAYNLEELSKKLTLSLTS
jgi:methyl-accepting chemotaxis protein